MARCKGAEANIVCVRDTQADAEGNRKVRDDEKLHALPESNSEKATLGCTDLARFGEAALEAAKRLLEDNKVIDYFV